MCQNMIKLSVKEHELEIYEGGRAGQVEIIISINTMLMEY
jgi:hypothetical protein